VQRSACRVVLQSPPLRHREKPLHRGKRQHDSAREGGAEEPRRGRVGNRAMREMRNMRRSPGRSCVAWRWRWPGCERASSCVYEPWAAASWAGGATDPRVTCRRWRGVRGTSLVSRLPCSPAPVLLPPCAVWRFTRLVADTATGQQPAPHKWSCSSSTSFVRPGDDWSSRNSGGHAYTDYYGQRVTIAALLRPMDHGLELILLSRGRRWEVTRKWKRHLLPDKRPTSGLEEWRLEAIRQPLSLSVL